MISTTIRPGRGLTATAALAVAGLIAGTGAGMASAHAGHAHTQNVTIGFTAVNGNAPVSCAAPLTGLGTGGTTAALKDLRFHISNVRLVRRDGSSVALKLTGSRNHNVTVGGNRVTLIDLEDGTGACDGGDRGTNAVIRGTVPRGAYVGARMYLGVPFALNHSDITTAPRPLDLAALSWGWQAGRKFTQIELTDPAGAGGTWQARTFMVHLGSTGCVGNPATGGTASCARSNRASIRLARFNPARQRIAVDIGALVAGVDVTRNAGGAPGCMSGGTDPECGPVFDALGIGWSADGSGSGQPVGASAQRVFRAIPR